MQGSLSCPKMLEKAGEVPYLVGMMTRTTQSLISELLDAAKAAGADGADAMLARGEGTSIDLRLGKVEASERSEDFDAGLRVFVGQRNASISTSQLDSDNIKALAERAVAMAKIAPEDPYARLATADELATSIPELEMFDPYIPTVDTLTDMARAAEDAARSHKGITNSEGGSASHGVANILIATSNGFFSRLQTVLIMVFRPWSSLKKWPDGTRL